MPTGPERDAVAAERATIERRRLEDFCRFAGVAKGKALCEFCNCC
jgi:hypothetical protein